MKDYEGVTDEDVPINGGNWVNKNEDAGEAYNFTKCNGWYYGYVRPENLDIGRIETTNSDSLSNIIVIFFATKPNGGQFIIGWYKNAEVYRTRKQVDHMKRDGYTSFNAKAKVSNSYLVPVGQRFFSLPVRPGENNVWYGKDYLSKKQLDDITLYIDDPINYRKRNEKKIKLPNKYKYQYGLPRQPDIEKRKKVEKAAIDEVWKFYKLQKFNLKDISDKNYGWDLQATLGNEILKIEVKGLSGKDLIVELTANEYLHFIKKKKNYRLAVLTNALEKNKKLHIFQFIKEINEWSDLENNRLSIKPMEFARICIQK